MRHAKDWAGVERVNEVQKIVFSDILLSFNEAFLTSSTAGIIPVSRINWYQFQTGKAAPVTEAIRRGYSEYQENYFRDRGA